MKMKIYYAHCMAIYNTPQEKRDIYLLEGLGFEVENPNMPKHQNAAKNILDSGLTEAEVMKYFTLNVKFCDGLAFRSLPDGRIPAGVSKEIKTMRDKNGLVFELPRGLVDRVMSVEETIEYLMEKGQR